MIIENERDPLCWYLALTHPRQEDRSDVNLRAWNVETFVPKSRSRRYNEFTTKPILISKPLFPRYIFVRFNLEKLYHKIRFTRGIQDLVSFGNGPTPVSEEIIRLIQSRVGADGFVKASDELKPGDEVVVTEGPLRELAGVLDREIPASDRVRILLTTVGFRPHIVLDRQLVKKRDGDRVIL